MLRKLRSRYDEAYRIENGWGLSPVRSERELRALIRFCEAQLKEEHIQKYNPTKRNVLKETVRLYHSNDRKLYDYINENIGYYWS